MNVFATTLQHHALQHRGIVHNRTNNSVMAKYSVALVPIYMTLYF